MGFEGRKLDDNLVMFGSPVSEKALDALKRKSPSADSIIKSLPPSAFIPMDQEVKAIEEEVKAIELEAQKKRETEELLNAPKYRRERKRQQALEAKKELPKPIETPIVEEPKTIIEQLIKPIEKVEPMIDLDAELNKLSSEIEKKKAPPAPPPAPVVQEAPRQEPFVVRDQIMELLAQEPNPPSYETIQAWKDRYGRTGIHVMAFGEGEVYVYHHLTRSEWKKIKELMNKLRESEDADEVEEKLKEKVVLYCVLYPSLNNNWLEYCKAGVLDSLYQMILLNSGFLTPQQAMLLTTQL
jgi:hypothetical protein